ncbi:MAG: hypothetical protein ABGZ17_29795, partial [Planctomycetaceae bacterium]
TTQRPGKEQNPPSAVSNDRQNSAQMSPLQWTDFPFMTAADRLVAVVQPATLAESATLISALELLPLGDNNLPIPPSETEWVAIYAAPLIDDDGGITGDVTVVLKLNRPSSVSEIAESRFDTDQFESVEADGLSYLRVSGLTRESKDQPTDADSKSRGIVNLEVVPDMAVYEYDEYTYVVCEEGRLDFVLNRSDIESPLRDLVGQVESKSPLFLAMCFQDRPLVSSALETQAGSLDESKLLQTFAANSEAVVLSGDLEGETMVRMAFKTSANEQADAIERAVHSAVMTGGESLDALRAVASPATQQMVETGQKLLDGIKIERNKMAVDVAITNPGNLPQFFKSLATLVSQTGLSQ